MNATDLLRALQQLAVLCDCEVSAAALDSIVLIPGKPFRATVDHRRCVNDEMRRMLRLVPAEKFTAAKALADQIYQNTRNLLVDPGKDVWVSMVLV